MQMNDMIKRLAQIESGKPAKKTKVNESIAECMPMGPMGGMGMMGGMGSMMPPKTPASFSLNATAADGKEVSDMLSQILTLAGVGNKGGDDLALGAPGPADVEIDNGPGMDSPTDSMSSMIGKMDDIEGDGDSMNGGDEFGDDGKKNGMDVAGLGDEMGGEEVASSDDFQSMADQVHDLVDKAADLTGGETETAEYDNSPEPKSFPTDGPATNGDKGEKKEPDAKAGGGNPLTDGYTTTVESFKQRLMRDYDKFVTEAAKKKVKIKEARVDELSSNLLNRAARKADHRSDAASDDSKPRAAKIHKDQANRIQAGADRAMERESEKSAMDGVSKAKQRKAAKESVGIKIPESDRSSEIYMLPDEVQSRLYAYMKKYGMTEEEALSAYNYDTEEFYKYTDDLI